MADDTDRGVTRRRIRIGGVVQGVGFRYFVMREARGLEVEGWVRNLPDGDVLCEAQGPAEVMDRFLERLRRGPRFSQVERVDAEDLEPESGSGFAIR